MTRDCAPGSTSLLLVGAPGTEFRLAARMARDAGAEVAMVDTVEAALAAMRDCGADLAMIDVGADVGQFIAGLRRERIAVPVFACGIDVPAALAVAAIRAGACDYLPLPPDRALIAAAIVSVTDTSRPAIGADKVFLRATDLGIALARGQAPLLISGEPGAGKETLARSIHQASARAGRFVVVDCMDVDPGMIDSELFGHEQGAFVGAVARRRGRIAEAANGTVFLREVAALPLATQSRLSQLLDEQATQRLGGDTACCARIVAGTSLDLDECVADGRFRSSLLARLRLAQLVVPPLRHRGTDIVLLARNFSERFAHANDLAARPLNDAALALIVGYDWPGNIRELENVLHRAVLLADGEVIPASAIVLADGSSLATKLSAATAWPERLEGLVGSTVEDVERALILETLKRCRGNRTSASTILGISVRTMRNKLKIFVASGIAVSPAS